MAELQSTNRVKLSKVRESTFGVTPTSPVFKTQRQTSSSLALNPQTVVSNEIRSDRQVTDLILVGLQAGGDVRDCQQGIVVAERILAQEDVLVDDGSRRLAAQGRESLDRMRQRIGA